MTLKYYIFQNIKGLCLMDNNITYWVMMQQYVTNEVCTQHVYPFTCSTEYVFLREMLHITYTLKHKSTGAEYVQYESLWTWMSVITLQHKCPESVLHSWIIIGLSTINESSFLVRSLPFMLPHGNKSYRLMSGPRDGHTCSQSLNLGKWSHWDQWFHTRNQAPH